MKATIDSAGRLVIPKEVRREAGLRPGMRLEVRWREGRIEIEPESLAVRLVRKGRLTVAVPSGSVPPLRGEIDPPALPGNERIHGRRRCPPEHRSASISNQRKPTSKESV